MSILDKIMGDPNEKLVNKIRPIVAEINNLEADIKKLSDEDLKKKTADFKKQLAAGKTLDDILPEVFAVVREASWRVIGLRHFDVQLIGGVVLHRGEITEMKTGEGKTLVATLALYLNALEEKGAHLITVNDYLARLGAGWMAPVYAALGMSISVIVHDNALIYDPEYNDDNQYDERLKHFRGISRRDAYYCDITYGTNNEFGFDYLRDNMVYSLDQAVQRTFHYCIVDEIDSILIDEARTPLIISAPAEDSGDRYAKFADLVQRLDPDEDYNIDEKMKAATLSENGIVKMEKWLGVDNIYVSGGIREVHHIEQALKARVLFKRDKDYVVKDGEIIIVDEFTGRLMPGRRYSEGLHQAIEAKEKVEVQKESQTMATITFQNLFRMYRKLSGMTGTAVTEAEEFYKIYKLETIVIPTHRPNIRKDLDDLIYRSEADKFRAVIRDIKERSAKGQPVLIGTISIEKNELLAEMMEREGLKPQMLNAKNHQREAEIIAQAGQRGAITLATNMAGRGVDIILGGNPATKEEQAAVIARGGLHVIGTERHESRRIDNQLRGRSGRQGDPGSSQFYVSAEDDLMRIFGGDRMKNLMKTLKLPADVPIKNKLISRSIESAQKKVEGNNFDTRKHLVEYDDVINKHRSAIYKRRREILEISEREEQGKNEGQKTLSDLVLEIVAEEIKRVVSFHTSLDNVKEWNITEIYETMRTIWAVDDKLKEKLLAFTKESRTSGVIRDNISQYLITEAKADYFSLVEKFKQNNLNFVEIEKGVLIRSIDQMWVEHLETIAYLRRGIGLRGYGQRDPLVEYKREAYLLYQQLNGLINKEVVYSVYKTGETMISSSVEKELSIFSQRDQKKLNFSGAAKQMQRITENSNLIINLAPEKVKTKDGKKVGRNDPCPCGSGKKYKKCHGK